MDDVSPTGALARTLASGALALLNQVFGNRAISLRLFVSSLLATLCVLSAVYLEMLFAVDAHGALFSKYGLVIATTSAGLVIAMRPMGSVVPIGFGTLVAIACALDRLQLQVFPVLLALAIPGLVLAPLMTHATRWALRRARTSQHAGTWLTGVIFSPWACLGARVSWVTFSPGAEARFSTFLVKLTLSAVLSCNLLLSIWLLLSFAWSGLPGGAKR